MRPKKVQYESTILWSGKCHSNPGARSIKKVSMLTVIGTPVRYYVVHTVGIGVTSAPHQCIVPMVVLVQSISLAFQHTCVCEHAAYQCMRKLVSHPSL